MFYKSEKEKCFAYSIHTGCDNNNFILGFSVTSGNIHDSIGFDSVYEKIKERYDERINTVAIDAAYITPHICKTIFKDEKTPVIPYKRPMTKEDFFKKYEYVYDEYYDCYLCPNDKVLEYSTTNRDGYREYKSSPTDCINCNYLSKCTNSKNNRKVVTRHIWAQYVEEANHLRHDFNIKEVYSRRKETIERVFADAKEKHGMRYTQFRGITKNIDAVTLIFACMNLKKLANKLWKMDAYYFIFSNNIFILTKHIHNIRKLYQKGYLAACQISFLSTV